MSKEIRKHIDKVKNFGQFLNENQNKTNLIGYHISEYDFNKFNSYEHIGNFGTILDASYFLSSPKEIHNFGYDGVLYKVKITPQTPFYFDLRTDEHWYLSTEFQELFSESVAGISNYLDGFFEEQNINSVNDIDCIILTNLDYLHNKKTEEYIVLNENIIQILDKKKIE